jgi:hypothetical protein
VVENLGPKFGRRGGGGGALTDMGVSFEVSYIEISTFASTIQIRACGLVV